MEFDRRKGWRGPITNKKYSDNWNSNLKDIKIEKLLNWNLAIVKKINKFNLEIETDNKERGIIEYNDVSWIKGSFNELFNLGDIIYVQKKKNLNFILKQNLKIVFM